MSWRGIGFLLLTCAFAVGTFAAGSPEFLAALAVSAALVVIALLLAVVSRPVCRLETDEPSAPRAEKRIVRVTLENHGILPALRVRVRLSLVKKNSDQGAEPVRVGEYICDIPARSARYFEAEAVCPHRGEYAVAPDRFSSEDLFGFFRFRRERPAQLELLALPRLCSGPRLAVYNADEDDGSDDKSGGDSGEMQPETRAYRAGDSMRSIHWKQSVKRRQLATRLRERVTEPAYALLLNTVAGADNRLEYEDTMCECALSVLYALLSERRNVALMPGGPPRAAQAAVKDYARALAVTPFSGSLDAEILLDMLRKRDIPDVLYYISADSADSAGAAENGDISELAVQMRQLELLGCEIVRLCPEPYFDERMSSSGFESYAVYDKT